jgi:hypothetical protein
MEDFNGKFAKPPSNPHDYVVHQPKPLVTPGEIVERKRVAEVMTSIKAVQDDPDRWESRGDTTVRSPLKGSKSPPGKRRRADTVGVPKRPPRAPMASSTSPSPLSPAGGEQRLGAALWFANSFHAVDAERARKNNAEVDKLNRKWFKEMTQSEPRKGPRRATPPPRPLASSASARPGKGSPRFARRLRRP